MLSNSEELVTPGAELGVMEEYVGSEGTYYDENGKIRSSVVGKLRYDKNLRIVSVAPFKRPLFPRQGSEVLGIVTSVHRDLVVVEIYAEVRTQPRFTIVGEYQGTFIAGIPLSQISDDFIKDIYDYFRIGDVIVAKVISKSLPLTLSTKAPLYGVIYAQCSLCGASLLPVSQSSMKCAKCGNTERRKVSALAIPRPPQVRLKRLIVRTLS